MTSSDVVVIGGGIAGVSAAARLIESGFVPTNDEERLFMAPPQSNRDVSNWKDDAVSDDRLAEQQAAEPVRQGLETEPESNPELDELRRRLEGLL